MVLELPVFTTALPKEMQGIFTFSMILEPPATQHSITQTRKCREFFAFAMILELAAPHHSNTQTRKCVILFFDFQ